MKIQLIVTCVMIGICSSVSFGEVSVPSGSGIHKDGTLTLHYYTQDDDVTFVAKHGLFSFFGILYGHVMRKVLIVML
jgi:hypothetical protein